MKVFQNFQKFRVLWHRRAELREFPGRYKNAVSVPRVFVAPAYRTYRDSGYRYESPTEFTEVPGTGNTQVNTRPRGWSSIGVEDCPTCMACYHCGPASPRQSVVALRAIANHHRDDKSLTSTSTYRGNSRTHVYCSVTGHTMGYPGCGASKK